MRSHSANDESDQTIYLSAPSDQIVSLLVKVLALDQLDNTITLYPIVPRILDSLGEILADLYLSRLPRAESKL